MSFEEWLFKEHEIHVSSPNAKVPAFVAKHIYETKEQEIAQLKESNARLLKQLCRAEEFIAHFKHEHPNEYREYWLWVGSIQKETAREYLSAQREGGK